MLMIAWTTVATRSDAERLASGAVTAGLAACVQIDGPMRSIYRWEGKIENSDEFRLTFKCLPGQLRPWKSMFWEPTLTTRRSGSWSKQRP